MFDLRHRLLAGWLCLVALGCGGEGGRVLVIGIDGATFRIAEPLLAEGRLPNLERIADRGASAPLRSIKPLASPLIWNSIATGKMPEKHGITSFVTPEGEERRLLLSSDRRTHALWNMASREGKRVAVVNFWNTYPVEQVRGVIVSDHALTRQISGRERLLGASSPRGGNVVHPASRQDELLGVIARDEPVVPNENPFVGPGWLPQLADVFRTDSKLVRVALRIEEETSPDLLMVLLPGIDRISHFLWRNVEPPEKYPPEYRLSDEERAQGKNALYAYYEYTDALIGKLVERFGPDDLVIVLSDHGFEAGIVKVSGPDRQGVTGQHLSDEALHGVLFARGRRVESGEPSRELSVLDVTPTVLAWWGLPVGDDMDGQVAPFLVDTTPTRIATWDTEPIQRASAVASGAEEGLIDELRSLGYLE